MKYELFQGDSAKIGILIESDYNTVVSNVYLGSDLFVPTLENGLYVIGITSDQTSKLLGIVPISVTTISDAIGVRKFQSCSFNVKPSNRFSTNQSSDLIDLTMSLNVKNGGVIADSVIANIYKGKSAYDSAVENGFIGTEAEWVEQLRLRNIDYNAYYILSKT